MSLSERTCYPSHPAMMARASNAVLAERHRIDDLFRDGELTLAHAQGVAVRDRRGGTGAAMLRLPDQTGPASAAGRPLLARRELGVVQVGGRECGV